jgi:hypothetical protein
MTCILVEWSDLHPFFSLLCSCLASFLYILSCGCRHLLLYV